MAGLIGLIADHSGKASDATKENSRKSAWFTLGSRGAVDLLLLRNIPKNFPPSPPAPAPSPSPLTDTLEMTGASCSHARNDHRRRR
jgi:hypothetical protein